MTFEEVKERVGKGLHSAADLHWLVSEVERLSGIEPEKPKPFVIGVAAEATGATPVAEVENE